MFKWSVEHPQPVLDELVTDAHKQMSFVEFLEALARCAADMQLGRPRSRLKIARSIHKKGFLSSFLLRSTSTSDS